MKKRFNRAACLALVLFCAVNSVNSYSKYGRGCADIGCMPNEVCIMAQESCSYGQRDGKDCGSYPTCKRNPSGGSIKPSDDGAASSHTSTHNLNADSGPSYNNGGSNGVGGSNTAGGFDGFSAGGHNLYPQLPTSNNPAQPNPAGGYGGYNNVNSGGYMPPGGGYHPPQSNGGSGGGGYRPPQSNGGSGGGGYSRPSYPEPTGPKDKQGGFFSNFLSNPVVSQAISGVISGQIQKALQGGGGAGGGGASQGGNTPSGGYSSGGSSSGSNILGGLFGSVLSGGSSPSNRNSGLGMLGDLIGGSSGNRDSSSGGFGDFFKQTNFKGLFNEKPPANG